MKCSNFAIDYKVDKQKSEICLDSKHSIKVANKYIINKTNKEATTNDTTDYSIDFMWGEPGKICLMMC